jgi:antitoxin component YwqK of YwqJK toxin-antitoxin module
LHILARKRNFKFENSKIHYVKFVEYGQIESDSIVITFKVELIQNDTSSSLSSIERYVSGKYEGYCIFVNSEFKTITYYCNGKKNKEEIILNIVKNNIDRIENFENGKKDGIQFYFVDGKLRSKVLFKNGLPNGEFVLYGSNGCPIIKGKVKGYLTYKKIDKEFLWYKNNNNKPLNVNLIENGEDYQFEGLPDYIPPSIFQVKSGYEYYIRKGKWKFFDEEGNIRFYKRY